ncbi:glycoside hydrolase family 17 protein [Sphaerobolus stellatus SS14]|nr:glycoside hydrolase family 17 protein [Sphaerobolus stellatus SS14]
MTARAAPPCFPSHNFQTPALSGNETAPSTPLNQWWCDINNEQGFLGFSYYVIRIPSVEVCMNSTYLLRDFTRMRTEFNARYVRLYSWCDDDVNFFNDVINAAYQAGIGVYATVWFGFDGTDQWEGRRDNIIQTVKTNPLAPYVIRSIDVGSEPLFDGVLPADQLADQVVFMQQNVHPFGIGVAISEMQYGYTSTNGSQAILDVIDFVHAHNLPFFDWDAVNATFAWPSVKNSTDWFYQQTGGKKKIMFTQTGWPSNAEVWLPNVPSASSTVSDEETFARLLDSKCEFMKETYGHGGVGWFWQIYSEESLSGWGWIQGSNGAPKFSFKPRTAC